MGKLPVALLLALALWIGWTVYEEGPDEAFGGFFTMFYQDKHGENAPKTRSGVLADRALQPAEPDPEPDDWWSQ